MHVCTTNLYPSKSKTRHDCCVALHDINEALINQCAPFRKYQIKPENRCLYYSLIDPSCVSTVYRHTAAPLIPPHTGIQVHEYAHVYVRTYLIAPFIYFRHVNIIHKCCQFLPSRWSVRATHTLVNIALNCSLEMFQETIVTEVTVHKHIPIQPEQIDSSNYLKMSRLSG